MSVFDWDFVSFQFFFYFVIECLVMQFLLWKASRKEKKKVLITFSSVFDVILPSNFKKKRDTTKHQRIRLHSAFNKFSFCIIFMMM